MDVGLGLMVPWTSKRTRQTSLCLGTPVSLVSLPAPATVENARRKPMREYL